MPSPHSKASTHNSITCRITQPSISCMCPFRINNNYAQITVGIQDPLSPKLETFSDNRSHPNDEMVAVAHR
jgi:hypothetical protein